jgi:hypothetical protein
VICPPGNLDIAGDRSAADPSVIDCFAVASDDLQADDIDAGRQQHGDAHGDNDQEEFSHGVPFLRT